MNVAILILLGFLITAFFIAVKGSKNNTLEQWSVGGRSFGVILIFILMCGELYTTFTFLGGSSLAYSKGGLCYYILCFSPIAYIMGYWFTPAVWQYGKKMNLVSQSDFFVAKYQSNFLGFLVSIIGIIALIPYLLLQIKGLGIIVSETSGGIISPDVAIWGGSVVLVIYVIIAGLKGSVKVALVKDVLILTVVLFLGIYLPIHYYGSIHQVFVQVEIQKPNFTIISNPGSNAWVISTIMLSGLGMYLWPHGFSSIYAASSADSLRRNAIVMPLYQIVLMFVFVIGFVAFLQIPGLTKSAADLSLLRLVSSTFNPWVVGIIGGVGILTALVPGSIILLTTATLLVKNIYLPLMPNSKVERLTLVKLAVPVIMLLTLTVNHFASQTIVGLLIVGYGIVTQLFPSLVFSFFVKNPVNKFGAISGIILSVSIVFLSFFSKTNFMVLLPMPLQSINIGIIALIINTFVAVLFSRLTRKYFV